MIHICPLSWELKYSFSSDLSESESLLLFFHYYPIVRDVAVFSGSGAGPGSFKLVKILSKKQVESFLNKHRLSARFFLPS